MKLLKKIKNIFTFYLIILFIYDGLFIWRLYKNDFVMSKSKIVVFIFVPILLFVCMEYVYQKNVKVLFHRIDERERSIEDMLKLVEAKCDEARTIAKNKSEFLSNMSHEIRTPINAVLGMNEMIMRECDDDLIFSYAYNVRNSGNMLLSLVNDILDFSKIESGKMEIVCTNYHVSSIINDLVNMTNSRMKDKDLKLELEISPDIPTEVYGDDVRIKQILVNLLTNAVKYTPKGKIIFRVTGEQKDNFYLFRYEVEDTGIGIKEEDLKKLADKFVRFDQRKNKNIEGTGLGLNITNRLLALMGSKLQVRSVYEKGSTFYFDLEQKIVDFTPMGNFEYKFDDHLAAEKYQVSYIAPDACVLVVDDNEMNRKVFNALLKETQIKIEEADSGKVCLERIHEKKYDIIFMDHMMPEMDGIETFHRIRESEHHYNIETPVIILTANAVAGAKEKYLAEGFEAFLSKPIVPDNLEKVIFDYLPADMIKKGEPKKKKQEAKIIIEDQPSVEGLDWNYAALHFPDQESLSEAVNSFYRSVNAEGNKLKDLYVRLKADRADEEARNLYRIQVHAMKSAANIIGLVPLSGSAAVLEYAARDGKLDMIVDTTPYFLDNWIGYKEKLQECVKEEEKSQIENMNEVIEALKQLISAVESFDINLSDHIMEYLRGLQFDSSFQECFDNLEAAVANLEDETVAVNANKIIEILGGAN